VVAETEALYGLTLPREYAAFLKQGRFKGRDLFVENAGEVYFVVARKLHGYRGEDRELVGATGDDIRRQLFASADGVDLATLVPFARLGDEDGLGSSVLAIDISKANKHGQCPVLLYEHDAGTFEEIASTIEKLLEEYAGDGDDGDDDDDDDDVPVAGPRVARTRPNPTTPRARVPVLSFTPTTKPTATNKVSFERVRQSVIAGGTWYVLDERGFVIAWIPGKPTIIDRTLLASWDTAAGAIVDAEGSAVVVSCKGVLARIDGSKLRVERKASKIYGERHNGIAAGWDSLRRRHVVWGGEVKRKPSNDTLVFERTDWRVLDESPRPKDRAMGPFPFGYRMLFDAALRCMVRFGPKTVSLLRDDEWVTYDVKGYSRLGKGPRALTRYEGVHYFPMHDRSSGETLLLNVLTATLVRFDLGGCEVVATIEPFAFAADPSHVFAPFCEPGGTEPLIAFDARTRVLFAQQRTSATRYALPLAEVFEDAHARGPRRAG